MDRNRWFGTWRLESMELHSLGGVTTYPYGRNPTGYIMYLEPDRMAVTLGSGDRPPFAAEDMLGGTDQEKSAAFSSFLSYCGTFQVGEHSVVHHIDVSLFPNWVGTRQERLYEFEGDALRLSSRPFRINGEQQTVHLVWRRV
ncbi:MAG TPA: lipocalin-like domain-containing protein [Spirochaetia bacterium]|nr:lipocalin-like domain-containing protein [Spirochaetia bacterium]